MGSEPADFRRRWWQAGKQRRQQNGLVTCCYIFYQTLEYSKTDSLQILR
jgi:hypothetical protein